MLKIGDFSKLSHVTVKALRLYDQLGLLKPTHVDHLTGYRYYCADQLPRLNRILALKDLGFSLEQIAKLLAENLSPVELRGMLRLKQAELQQLVEEEQARLFRVEAKLKQIEQENTMPNYEVVIKTVEPLKVAAIREILPNSPSIALLYNELFEYFKQHGVKVGHYCGAIWHDSGYKESDVDWEAVVSFNGEIASTHRVKVYELPGVEKMACVVHHGSYNTINQAYAALPAWIENNGYKIMGSNREVYIIGGDEQDNESYLTEVQFPTAKV
ncbi:MerR family transcriptional regulator [Nostocales cyanobacterium HT-58-2]|nr:MerR family transcriptional regulator [Nostocales cyanobacterium HT-58-2]